MFSRSRRNVYICNNHGRGNARRGIIHITGCGHSLQIGVGGGGGGGESYSPSSPMVYKLFFSFLYSYLIDTSEVSGIVSQDYSPWFVGSI